MSGLRRRSLRPTPGAKALLVPTGAMLAEATPGRAAPQGGRVTVPMQRDETLPDHPSLD